MPSSDSQPLLQTHNSQPSNPSSSNPKSFKTIYHICRRNAHSFLSSQYQHYVVLGLVACDLLGIFADIIIDLYQCDTPSASPKWNDVKLGLGIAGLVFSCMFMLELFFCAWAFGLRFVPSLLGYEIPLFLNYSFSAMFCYVLWFVCHLTVALSKTAQIFQFLVPLLRRYGNRPRLHN